MESETVEFLNKRCYKLKSDAYTLNLEEGSGLTVAIYDADSLGYNLDHNILKHNSKANSEFEEFRDSVKLGRCIQRLDMLNMYVLDIIRNNETIQASIKRRYNECTQVIVQNHLKILEIAYAPYDKIVDTQNIIMSRAKGGFSHLRNTKFTTNHPLAMSRYGMYSLSYVYNDKLLIPPSGTITIQDELSERDNISQIITTRIERIQAVFDLVSKHERKIRDYLDTDGCYFRSSMSVSSFNKLSTVINSNSAESLISLEKLKRSFVSYVDDDIVSNLKKILACANLVALKPTNSFSITIKGVQFKIINVSYTRTKNEKYEKAFRFQVHLEFLNVVLDNIIRCDDDVVEYSGMIPFYNALNILDYPLFMDKLRMNSIMNV